MSQPIGTFTEIAGDLRADAVGAKSPTVIERVERSKRQQQVWLRALLGMGFAALWGLAAGSAAPAIALANVYKVPMVLALGVLVALPAVFVTWRLLQLNVAPFEMLSAMVISFYRASLVLLGVAPLLAVYAYTTQWVAPMLAQGSALLALGCGGLSLRNELSRIEAPRGHVTLLGVVAVVTTSLALLQLISLATPVLTLPTVFGSGIDGVLR